MAKSPDYSFKTEWLPNNLKVNESLKSDDERKKPEKCRPIEERPPKHELRNEPGNFEIDKVIGKREDNQALLTLIDIYRGQFYSSFFDRTMEGFRDALLWLKDNHKIEIKTLTINNNLLYKILPREYCLIVICIVQKKRNFWKQT